MDNVAIVHVLDRLEQPARQQASTVFAVWADVNQPVEQFAASDILLETEMEASHSVNARAIAMHGWCVDYEHIPSRCTTCSPSGTGP